MRVKIINDSSYWLLDNLSTKTNDSSIVRESIKNHAIIVKSIPLLDRIGRVQTYKFCANATSVRVAYVRTHVCKSVSSPLPTTPLPLLSRLWRNSRLYWSDPHPSPHNHRRLIPFSHPYEFNATTLQPCRVLSFLSHSRALSSFFFY